MDTYTYLYEGYASILSGFRYRSTLTASIPARVSATVPVPTAVTIPDSPSERDTPPYPSYGERLNLRVHRN